MILLPLIQELTVDFFNIGYTVVNMKRLVCVTKATVPSTFSVLLYFIKFE